MGVSPIGRAPGFQEPLVLRAQNTGETPVVRVNHLDPNAPAGRQGDQELVEQMLRRLRLGTDVRRQKLERIKKLLVAGVYENDLKLHVAADRLLGEVSPDERNDIV